MGNFTVPVEVFSEDGLRSTVLDAVVDTGATYTCLPETLLRDLGIVPVRRVESELADGSVSQDDLGVARLKVQDIEVVTYVSFSTESAPVLLGAIAMETALLVVDPVRKRLVPTRALKYGLGNKASTYPQLLPKARIG